MPVMTPEDKDQVVKPSHAEGERDQPGDLKEPPEKEFIEPTKPSQAEGERKPYT